MQCKAPYSTQGHIYIGSRMKVGFFGTLPVHPPAFIEPDFKKSGFWQKEEWIMGKIVAFSNQKGGIGKTTSAVNIAAGVAYLGKKVLLCDLDPQGNATSGVGISKKTENTIYEALVGRIHPKDAILDTGFKNLYCMPSTITLAGAEFEFVDIENREYRLKSVLEEVRNDFDYIFVDCPPSLGILTLNALAAADGVIVPMTCEYYAMEGLSQLMISIRQTKKFYNHNLEITGILITMYDKRLNLTRQVLEQLERYYSDKIFKTKVIRNVRLTEAPSHGMPAIYYDQHSKGAELYMDLAKELITRI